MTTSHSFSFDISVEVNTSLVPCVKAALMLSTAISLTVTLKVVSLPLYDTVIADVPTLSVPESV